MKIEILIATNLITLMFLIINIICFIYLFKYTKKLENSESNYVNYINKKKLNAYKVYNFIRSKRNSAYCRRIFFENLNTRTSFYEAQCIADLEKELKAIEEYMRKYELV